MHIEGQKVRDLFACCRNMQQKLHSISSQIFALKTFLSEINGIDEILNKHPLVKKAIENIEHETKYIYSGEENFPNVSEVLNSTREELRHENEWRIWSDYVGFKPEENNKEA